MLLAKSVPSSIELLDDGMSIANCKEYASEDSEQEPRWHAICPPNRGYKLKNSMK